MTTGYIGSTIPAKTIRTSTHDNLFHIAMLQTGDPLQWVAIAQLNGLIDPWLQGNSNVLIPPVFPTNSALAILPEIGGSSLVLAKKPNQVVAPIVPVVPVVPVSNLPLNQEDWPNPRLRGLLTGDQLGYIKPSVIWILNTLFPFAPHEMPNPRLRVSLAVDQLGYVSTPDLWILNTLFPFAPHEMPNPRGQKGLAADQLGYINTPDPWILAPGSLIPFAPHEMPNPQRGVVRNEFGHFVRYKILQSPAGPLPFRLTDWQNPRGAKGLAADQLGCLNYISIYNPLLVTGNPIHQPVFSNIYKVKRLNQHIHIRKLN